MRVNFFIQCFLVIFIIFSLPFVSNGREDDLFSKLKILPIKDQKQAPYFCLENLNGKEVELSQFRGKVIFLNFWATWCHPCREELPSMEVLWQLYKEKDFILLTISVDYEGSNRVKEFVEKYHYTFPVLIDQKGRTLDLFEIRGIPVTILIDKKGRMIGKAMGSRNWKSQEAMSLLNRLLQ